MKYYNELNQEKVGKILMHNLSKMAIFISLWINIMFLLVGCGVSKEIENEINNHFEEVKNELLEEYSEKDGSIVVDKISYSIDEIRENNHEYEISCTWNINVLDGYKTSDGQQESLYNAIESGIKSKKTSDGKGIRPKLTLNISGRYPSSKYPSSKSTSKSKENSSYDREIEKTRDELYFKGPDGKWYLR